MYVGGRLWHNAQGRLVYLSGRTERSTMGNAGETAWMNVTNTLVFLCQVCAPNQHSKKK